MTQLHHEILINAAPEKVWAALANLETVQKYNPSVAKAFYTSDNRSGVGASRQCDINPKGFSKEVVTDWVEGKLIGLDTTESTVPMTVIRWKTYLTPQGKGTLLTQDLEYSMKFGPLGSLLNALVVKRKMTQTLGDIFVSLKKYVENQ